MNMMNELLLDMYICWRSHSLIYPNSFTKLIAVKSMNEEFIYESVFFCSGQFLYSSAGVSSSFGLLVILPGPQYCVQFSYQVFSKLAQLTVSSDDY